MLVVGIDPGLAYCGVIVALHRPGALAADLEVLRATVLTTAQSTPRRGRRAAAWPTRGEHAARKGDETMGRARELARGLRAIVADAGAGTPRVVCHESFAMPSAPTMLQLGHVLGVIAALAEEWGAVLVSRGPREVKAAVATVDAGKAEVIAGVRALRGGAALPLPRSIPPSTHDHAYDAYAAIVACWGLVDFARARLEAGGPR